MQPSTIGITLLQPTFSTTIFQPAAKPQGPELACGCPKQTDSLQGVAGMRTQQMTCHMQDNGSLTSQTSKWVVLSTRVGTLLLSQPGTLEGPGFEPALLGLEEPQT